MNAHRLNAILPARMSLWVWRPWAAAPRHAQELRLLERRVAAARFGINAPQRFFGTSVHGHRLESQRADPTLVLAPLP